MASSALERFEQRVGTLKQRLQGKSVRRIGLFAAVLIFLVGTIYAAGQISLPEGGLVWWPVLLLCLVGIPATIILNTLEMELSARLLGRSFGLPQALSTTIMASAANMLPLPGAAMVRVAGLSGLGATLRESGFVTLALSLLWVGVALVFTGAFLATAHPLLAAVSAILGAAVSLVAVWILARNSRRLGLAVVCLVIRCAMVGVAVFRLALCFWAIGVSASLGQAMAFSLSGVVGSAVSIVPAGLGVRELVSAAIAPLAGLDPAAAFLATAGDRLVELVILLVLAIGVAVVSPKALAKRRPNH